MRQRPAHLGAPPPLAILCLAFLLLVGTHSVATPIFEAPDEVWHYAYVRWVAEGQGLPPLDSDVSGAYQEAAQPPLYYLVAALISAPFDDSDLSELMWSNPGFGHQAPGTVPDNKNMLIHTRAEKLPWRGAVLAIHATRLTSWLFGLLTVVAAYGLGLEAFGSRRWAVATASLVAFQPQFAFISSVVSNDSAAAAVSTLALWLGTRIVVRGATLRRAAVAGALGGLALLTKTSVLPVVPLLAVCLGMGSLRRDRSIGVRALPHAVKLLALQLTVSLVVGGWWYVRNWTIYGQLLGLATHTDTPWGRGQPATFGTLVQELPLLVRSFWAAYGWGHVTWPDWVYAALTAAALPPVVVGIATTGRTWLVCARRYPHNRPATVSPPPADLVAAGLSSLWALGILGALLQWMRQVEAPHGRLLFPALGAMALLLVVGMRQLAGHRPRMARGLGRTLLLACVALATLAPGARILATFAPPRLRPADQVSASCAHPVDIALGGQARLVCADVAPTRAVPGDHLTLRVCWESLAPTDRDLTVFTHLIGPQTSRPAERHTYPGMGRYPTSLWLPGTAFCDTYDMDIADWAETPIRYELEVGLYDAETGDRLPAASGSTPLASPIVGAVDVVPAIEAGLDPASQAHLAVLADGRFSARLIKATSPALAAPGDTVTVSLTWQALTLGADTDYAVFVHLWEPGEEQPYAQSDTRPRRGWFPTAAWAPGDTIPDAHDLHLPENLPPGVYTIWAGLYSPTTGERVPASAAGNPFTDAMVPAATIEIR